MYYALNIYPQFDMEASLLIDSIRTDFDPTAVIARPHITVMFPIPDRVGEDQLFAHIQMILKDVKPFEIELGDLYRAHDHWLFLILTEGAERLQELYDSIYSGLLAEFRKPGITYIPHLSLGLFIKEGRNYDWNNINEDDFDDELYAQALERARELPLPIRVRIDKFNLTKIPDEILEWATGKRTEIRDDVRIFQIREFSL